MVAQQYWERKTYRARKAHEVTRKVVHHIGALLVRVLLAIAIRGSRRIKGNAIEWAATVQGVGDLVVGSRPEGLGI